LIETLYENELGLNEEDHINMNGHSNDHHDL